MLLPGFLFSCIPLCSIKYLNSRARPPESLGEWINGRESGGGRSHTSLLSLMGYLWACLTSLWLGEMFSGEQWVTPGSCGEGHLCGGGEARKYSIRSSTEWQQVLHSPPPNLCFSVHFFIFLLKLPKEDLVLLLTFILNFKAALCSAEVNVCQKPRGKTQNSSRRPQYPVAFLKYWSVLAWSHSQPLSTSPPTPSTLTFWVRT